MPSPPYPRRPNFDTMKRRLRLAVFRRLACSALLIAASAGATPASASVDFALHLSRLDVPLNTGQQAGVISFDTGRHPLQPGLAVGYAYVSDNSQTVTAGMELEGFYLAPALRGVLCDGPRLTATLTAAYLYQRVKDSNATDSVTLEWQQPQLDLDVKYRIGRELVVLLGGQYGRIDVDEHITGSADQTFTLEHGAAAGYRAGLEVDLGDDGQVGILVHRALGDGVEIYFQRQF
jgi:hypothetical protein